MFVTNASLRPSGIAFPGSNLAMMSPIAASAGLPFSSLSKAFTPSPAIEKPIALSSSMFAGSWGAIQTDAG
jgi:hypothetical protein